MPVTIPSNVAAILLLQCHLCASLAAMGGRDPLEDSVREQAIQCILNSRELDLLSADENDDPEDTDLVDRVASKLGERGARFLGKWRRDGSKRLWAGQLVPRASFAPAIYRSLEVCSVQSTTGPPLKRLDDVQSVPSSCPRPISHQTIDPKSPLTLGTKDISRPHHFHSGSR